jgi:AcrR family transcriptional regulator
MPRLTEASRLSRRREIADAALRSVARLGIAHTTMADVVTESGLSAGSIYSHFTSKSELLVFAFESEMARREAIIERLIAARGHLVAPIDVAAEILTELDRKRDSTVLLQMWAASVTDPELAATIAENTRQLHRVMDRAITPWARGRSENEAAAGRLAHDTSTAVVALMQGYLVQIALDSPPDLPSFLGLIEGIFNDGVQRAVGTSHA